MPKEYWSLACLDAIDKANFMPIKRTSGKWIGPNSAIPGEDINASSFLPFGQEGYVLDNTLKKKKHADRPLKARYLRATSQHQYLVLVSSNNTTRLIRQEELLLESKMERMVKAEQHYADASDYEPCCDWVMHPAKKALRAKIIAGARRLPSDSKRSNQSKGKYSHKEFVFVPDNQGKGSVTFQVV